MLRRSVLFMLFAVLLAACNLPSGDLPPIVSTPVASPTIVFELETPTDAPEIPSTATSEPAIATVPFVNPTDASAPAPTRAEQHPPTQTVQAPPTPTIQALTVPQPALATNPRYSLQPGTPTGSTNFLHPDAGCNWTGIGGQVFGSSNLPVTGLIVEVIGTLEGNNVVSLGLTGNAQALGPGGYEIPLADRPAASQGTLRAQVFDLNGTPLSNPVTFDTYADCSRNLVLINFVENKVSTGVTIYFPWVFVNR